MNDSNIVLEKNNLRLNYTQHVVDSIINEAVLTYWQAMETLQVDLNRFFLSFTFRTLNFNLWCLKQTNKTGNKHDKYFWQGRDCWTTPAVAYGSQQPPTFWKNNWVPKRNTDKSFASLNVFQFIANLATANFEQMCMTQWGEQTRNSLLVSPDWLWI